ncbi:M48 family metallopeptidase [Acinetobacter shaoyimingii]|uniref:M48 family metallopeptidase n=1 Tax=Acinetobacter shaoyimingii TaxID=2715164 RepID=A0A6G8RX70_9GAMM|nr:M48 family metallopeptidase [Acinetobacter shaoyimingii]NHB57054.1 M48 family metallopeptidase [Acinetobacter shaoyimingii]QIO06323.1 M48 family metallopeptidase [Acinetobacter shaoyimingii]
MLNKNLVLTFGVVVGLSGCTTVAELTGNDSATLNMNAAQDYQLLVDSAKSQKALDTTSSTYKRVNAVFLKMKPYADQANQTGQAFDWKLSVFKSDDLNAFVMPGGKVVFFTGIVNKLKLTDAEIAAIMGHEMTHALEEHSKRSAGATKITNLAVKFGKDYAGQKLGDMGTKAVDIGSKYGVGLPYSRSLESKADRGGLMLMAKAGYNPEAAITVWEKMNKADGGSTNGVQKFTSTHPSNNDRITDLKKSMPEAKQLYAASQKRK